MPLDLDDPRWAELNGCYGGTTDVIRWLRELYEKDSPIDDVLGDLVNEVQHQGDTSTAMYAVAVHLVAMARDAMPEKSRTLLIQAGLTFVDSGAPTAVECPSFLRSEFDAAAVEGLRLLSALTSRPSDFDTFKYTLAALAGFAGHHAMGRLLARLAFHEGRFYHPSFSEPFE